MTVQLIDGKIIYHCDGKDCDKSLETGESEIDRALWFQWNSKWRTYKKTFQGKLQWVDICPESKVANLKEES